MAEPAPEKDLGAGSVPLVNLDLAAEELKVAQASRLFRRILFWLSVIVILLFYGAFLYYALCKGVRDDETVHLTLSAFLAAVPTIILLALFRHVFKDKEDKKDEKDTLSIWQGLAKEAIEVFRKK